MRVFPARVVKFGLTSLLACIFGCRLRKQFAQPHFNKLIRLRNVYVFYFKHGEVERGVSETGSHTSWQRLFSVRNSDAIVTREHFS